MEALLGGLFGGLLRLAPELLSFLDRKNERKHELELGDQQFRVAELQFREKREIKDLDVEQSQFVSAMQALTEGVKSQATQTGIKWVDAFSAIIRPGITTWIFALYSAVKIAALTKAMQTMSGADAVLSVWDADDKATLAAVVMFWFVGRVWKSRVQG
jgi:hypothetical protein